MGKELEFESVGRPRRYGKRRDDDAQLLLLVEDALGGSRPVLLRGAAIVSMDPRIGDIPKGDVLIRGGVIVAVGAHVASEGDIEPLVVDLTGMIVLPGLVDAHRHCWQGQLRHSLVDVDLPEYVRTVHETWAPRYSPEDIAIGTLVSVLASLNGGVTTVLDFAHNSRSLEHSNASFRSYADAGIRAVHALGAPRTGTAPHWPHDAVRLRSEWAGGLSSVRLALYTPQRDRMAQLIGYARDHSLGISIDAVAGADGSEMVLELARSGSLGADVVLIHCAGLSHDAWTAIAETDTQVTLATTSDALIGMGDGSTPVREVAEWGVPASLSTDVETSLSGDLFAEMRATLIEQRRSAQVAVASAAHGENLRLPARTVLEMATIGGARALGFADSIGSITPGKQADLVVLRGQEVDSMPMNSSVATAVMAGHPGLVDSVFVAGAPRKWRGHLVGCDLDLLQTHVARSRDRLLGVAGSDSNYIPSITSNKE